MKKTFTKYIFSSIKHDLSRLIAIFVIVVLGLGFLVGLKSTSPDLQATMSNYFNDTNFMDVYIQSTLGFSKDDVDELNGELTGVSSIEGYYQTDEFAYIDGKKNETRLIYRDFNDTSIDKLSLVSGKFPENSSEVLMLNNSSSTVSHEIGTEVKVLNSATNEYDTYTICGLVKDPFYISHVGDVTTIGSGVLDAVLYFDSSFYEEKDITIIKIRYSEARKYNTYSKEYEDFIAQKVDEINEVSAPFIEKRIEDIKAQMTDMAREEVLNQLTDMINNNENLTDEMKQFFIDALTEFSNTEEFEKLVATQIDQTFEEQFGTTEATWYVLTRDENQGAYMFKEDSTKVDAISTVFPVFFFVIALLVSITSVTRIINKDRQQMGTLKSLGYSQGMIYTKYLIYGLLTSILGAVVGVIFGLFILPSIIGFMYGTIYDLGAMVYIGDPGSIALYSILMVILIVLTITIIAFASLKDNVSSLMLGKAPTPGKKIMLEHIPFIWKHLKFNTKSMLRNVFRFKKNLIMMLIGVGGCTGLLLTGFGLKDSLSVINTTQFNTIIKYDFIAKLDSEGMEGEDPFDVGISSKSYYYEGDALGSKDNVDFYMISTNSLTNYIGLDHPETFDNDSVVITNQIAEVLGVEAGDNITIRLDELNNTITQIRVTGITQNYIGNYLYVGEGIMKNYFPTLVQNSYIVDTQLATNEEVNAYIDEVIEYPNVLSVISSQNTKLVYESVLNNLDAIVVIVVLLCGALIAVVIYNLTDIMVSERIKEIATLRVNGYYRYESLLYIFREIFFMSGIGIIIGIVVGVFLHRFVIGGIESIGLTFGHVIGRQSYIYTILLAVGFVCLVCVLFFRKINAIKMAEALKSAE